MRRRAPLGSVYLFIPCLSGSALPVDWAKSTCALLGEGSEALSGSYVAPMRAQPLLLLFRPVPPPRGGQKSIRKSNLSRKMGGRCFGHFSRRLGRGCFDGGGGVGTIGEGRYAFACSSLRISKRRSDLIFLSTDFACAELHPQFRGIFQCPPWPPYLGFKLVADGPSRGRAARA